MAQGSKGASGAQEPKNAPAGSPWVIGLDQVGRESLALVGGKAANLGELVRAGLPVPSGFCVTTKAYRAFLDRCGISDLLTELSALSTGDLDAVQVIGTRIRAQILSNAVPEEVSQAILEALEPFGPAQAWAVRSSATAEDQPDASFAGQQDTFLNVKGAERVTEQVRACFASLFGDRAIIYRLRRGIEQERAWMAVLVQTMVPAEAAGVAFTVDPVSGSAERMVLEATVGLGEALVSGRVSPDRFVVDKTRLEVVDRTISVKTYQVVGRAEGGVDEGEVAKGSAGKPSVGDDTVLELARLALQVERVMGGPQDIEWAVAAGQVALLQSRPITTLNMAAGVPILNIAEGVKPAASFGASIGGSTTGSTGHKEGNHGNTPAPEEDAWEASQVWSNMNVGEVIPDVVTPFTFTFLDQTILLLFRKLLDWVGIDPGEYPLYGRIAGRLYFNLNTVLGMVRAMPIVGKTDPDQIFGGLQNQLRARGGLEVLERNIPKVRLHPFRLLFRVPFFGVWYLSQSLERAERCRAGFVRRVDNALAADLSALSPSELVNELFRRIREDFGALAGLLGYPIVAIGSFSNLDKFLRRWLPGEESPANALLTGLGDMASAEAGLELWRLAAKAHESSEVEKTLRSGSSWAETRDRLEAFPKGKTFITLWENFMTQHGHHARGEIELANPRWSEEPDYVLTLVQGYLDNRDRIDPVETHRKRASAREQTAWIYRRRLSNPVKRLLFGYLLKHAQQGVVFRENLKSDLVRYTAGIRRMALEVGRRLVARGSIDAVEDVFFLELEELRTLCSRETPSAEEEGLETKKSVALRRDEYAINRTITPPSVVVGCFDPENFQPDEVDTSLQVFHGLAVSPGVVTGPARVILRADVDEKVLPGEILVAPFTDPGWTPYFLPAAALVADMGGLLSHGSIVAREYGIPAVVNVGPATRIIRTGQLLRVDGNRGEVRILSSSGHQ